MTEEGAPSGCDFCTRGNVPIKRRYRGLRYCSTCYAREFKPRPCPQCGQAARLPVDRPMATCRACERREPCLHCAKVDERRGKTTADGRICGSCAQRLRESEPCELCGTMSNRLARNTRLGHDLRVCPRCQRVGHGTCQACGRHRALERTADGRLLCRRCREEGEKACESCGQTMPAGYGRRCRDCEGTERAHRRIKALAATLEPTRISEHFGSFGEWLVKMVGPHRAARDVGRYVRFFEEVGTTWGDVPDYPALIAHFGAERLRQRRRALRWMIEHKLVAVETAVRENDSERRRIAGYLDRLPEGSRAKQVLKEYHAELAERARTGTLSLRSIRLSLTPAVALLEAAVEEGHDLPSQETLDAVLRRSPGQHAALAGFVRWLREEHKITIGLPRKNRSTALRRRRQTAREEMLSLLREGVGGSDVATRWRVAALAYFHDVTLKTAREVQEKDIRTDRDGLHIKIKNKRYWIPTPPCGAGDGDGVSTRSDG